jgi:serine/threonine-protein kinase
MGCVWKARHLTLGIDVAIKFIDSSLARSDEVRSRFAQEAQAAARIKSPHVVNILDYGTEVTGRPYIAMELLEGEDLGSRLAREGTLSVAETARIITQACRGLSKAHAGGIVHRDLKPENLFLCEDDEGFLLKILDFGIAKAELAGASHKTAMGAVIGTPAYMSPEQARGDGKVDSRCDLYSLATVAYHALVGDPPFPADNLHSLLVGLIARMPEPVSVRQPHLTAKFDVWFSKALAKLPEDRFQTARELAESFLALCSTGSPPVDEWSFTGSDIRAVQQVIIDASLEETLRPSDMGDEVHREPIGLHAIQSSGTLKGVGDPANQEPDQSQASETHDAPPMPPAAPPLPSPVLINAPQIEEEEEDDTEIGGYFHMDPPEDRMRVLVPSDTGEALLLDEPVPFSSKDEIDVIVGSVVQDPEQDVDASPTPRESPGPGRLNALPVRSAWTTAALLFAIVVLLGSFATFGVMWLMGE